MEYWGNDSNLELMSLGARDIVASLTLNDVKLFLESLGVEQIEVNEEKEYIVCPTICHNPINEAESMKLYWYHNNKIFRCYTECNEAMSIFELYKRYMALNQYPVTFFEAEEYIRSFLHHSIHTPKRASTYDSEVEKYKYTTNIPQLKEYSHNALDCFIKYYHPLWLKDGITKEAMDRFDIRFSINQNKIIIPHFDINGRLIGIRARTLEKNEIEMFGKYRPIQVGDTIYTHSLQFNLYGIYEHQKGIRKRKSAIIAESEKSVLLDYGFYGEEYGNCVACCGSTFNKYHISLLTNILGANEIVVALDKEYDDWRSLKARKYREKILSMCKKYINQANFSYIWDYDNLLKEKDSPFDKGKDIFEELYKNRIKVR